MNKEKILKEGLDKLGTFDGTKNKNMKRLVKSLGEDVPYTMAVVLANYTMASFVGHFHWKLSLEEDNNVPINTINFVLAKSGMKKTSSVKKLRKMLDEGYTLIMKKQVQNAIAKSKITGEPAEKILPLSNSLSTQEGMIQRLNDFHKEGIGLPSLYVDEISTELATSVDIIPNIKLVAQLFDDGDTESKVLKNRETQSDEVKGMGMNALFIGSEYGILEDETILKKFDVEFMSKLGRRCFFAYPDALEEANEKTTCDKLLDELNKSRKNSKELKQQLGLISTKIARRSIDDDKNLISLSKNAKKNDRLVYDVQQRTSKGRGS